MKFSHNWIQDYIKDKLPSSQIIENELNAKAFEVEGTENIKYIQDEKEVGDTVYDIKILPNRAHDSLGHLGIARELSAIFNLELDQNKIDSMISDSFIESKKNDKVEPVLVEVLDNKHCSRFMSVKMEGIEVKESPEWLKNKLESIGQKSINNIVDITNYVQFSLNKPMHAYDSRNIENKIVVRLAYNGEKLETLDDKNLDLDTKTLIIADSNKPLGLAGIKGGKYSGIKKDTTDIVIESANFDPVLIRKTSQKYNIKTDASKRFENGISHELVKEGLCMTVNEILKLFPEATISEVVDTNSKETSLYYVGVTLNEINQVLGSVYTDQDIENVLNRYGFNFQKDSALNFMKENIDKVIGAEYKNPTSMREDAPEFFSCSSLVTYLYRGIWMPSLSVDKYVFSYKINKPDLVYGDLVFASSGEGLIRYESFEYKRGTKVEEGVDHVGIYIGDNKIIHATKTVGKVLVESFEDFSKNRKIIGYGRISDNIDELRYIITVPHQRLDLRIKEDMIEEVGRMIGYEKLHPKLPELNKKGKINKKLYYQNIIRNILNKRGFEEVITYSFTNKGDVSLIKSASDKNSLRVNVGEGLGEALIKNIYNMPLLNTSDVRLYEFGNVFRLDSDKNVIEKSYLAIGIDDGKKKTDYADLVDQVLIEIKKALNVKNIEYSDRNIKPYTLGIDFGKLINDLPEPEENIYLEGFEDENIKYKSFSLMPFIVRDIAFWCDENTDKQEILKLIEDNVGEFCIAVHIFDEFIKNIDGVNKKSLGYRLIYQAKDRTLTDEEVNEYAGNIYEILKEKGFEIR